MVGRSRKPAPEPQGPRKRADVPETISAGQWARFLDRTNTALNALPDEGAQWAENANRNADRARWS